MAPRQRTEADIRLAARTYAIEGTIAAAARTLGWYPQRVREHLHDGVLREILNEAFQEKDVFEIEPIPSGELDFQVLREHRRRKFQAKRDHAEGKKLRKVNIGIAGPYGVMHFGDPHVDDDGTDLDLLERDMTITCETEGMFGASVGDMSNNWVGRLGALYGEQSTTAEEAWMLVEWFVRSVPWLYLIGGNHDCWSGSGDPIKWMTRNHQGAYQGYGVRLGIRSPNGRVIRINARHDFQGHSQWNPVHGAAKAVQMGWRDHILTCGHKHTNGYNILKDPSTGLISHAIRVCSYKTYDRYAEEKGLPDQNISPCVTTIINPDLPDNHPGQVVVFHDPEVAARYLTMLRREWKENNKHEQAKS